MSFNVGVIVGTSVPGKIGRILISAFRSISKIERTPAKPVIHRIKNNRVLTVIVKGVELGTVNILPRNGEKKKRNGVSNLEKWSQTQPGPDDISHLCEG